MQRACVAQETPEKCLFPDTMMFNLFVEAVFPLLVASILLLIITLPWRA